MANKICPGGGVTIYQTKDIPKEWNWQNAMWHDFEGKHIKRIRMVCPHCKRRVLSSVEIGSDADYIIHTIPPHKVRYWWKNSRKG